MRRKNKKLISWLMVLILTVGFIPITSAQGMEAEYLAEHCASSVKDSSVSMSGSDIDKDPVKYCHDSSVCAVHYGCAPLQSSSELAVASAVVRRTILFEDTAIVTRYPAIPEHPPKV